jgi:hypothetical protein
MSEPEKLPDPSMLAHPNPNDSAFAQLTLHPQPDPIVQIATAIAGVMNDIGVVGKSGENKFQNYKYAKMENILQKLTPLIAKHGLVIIQTEVERSLFDNDHVIAIKYQFTIVHTSGSVWPDRPMQTGMSRCRDSKGGFDDKSMNKCHTAARKYFLLALFQIPTGDVDDADSADGQTGTNGGGKISANQLDALVAHMDEVGADATRFARYLGVATLVELPASRFAEAMAELDAKAKRGAK